MHRLTFQPLHLVARIDFTDEGVGISVVQQQQLGALIQRAPTLRQFLRDETLLLQMQTPELRKLLEKHAMRDDLFAKPAKFQKPITPAGQPPNDLVKLMNGLVAYHITFGRLPERNGPAVFKALVGANKRREVFVEWNPAFVAPDGSFLDQWGTPYSVSFPDAVSVEVRSAGPDKVLNTADDQFIRRRP